MHRCLWWSVSQSRDLWTPWCQQTCNSTATVIWWHLIWWDWLLEFGSENEKNLHCFVLSKYTKYVKWCEYTVNIKFVIYTLMYNCTYAAGFGINSWKLSDNVLDNWLQRFVGQKCWLWFRTAQHLLNENKTHPIQYRTCARIATEQSSQKMMTSLQVLTLFFFGDIT